MNWIISSAKKGNKRKDSFWKDYNNRLCAAKLCQTKSEYMKRFGGAYFISLDNNEMDQFSWFNKQLHPFDEEAKIHLIYIYLDEENKYFYVGRTLDYNFKTRCSVHRNPKKHDVVFRHWNSMNKPVPEPIIVERNLNTLESKIKEHEYEELYISYGYTKLNICPTGERSSSIGGISRRWNKETCYEAAKECTSRSEYSSKFSGAYQMSLIFGWLDDYTWFTKQKRISFDEAYAAACECETIAEFKKKYYSYYTYFKNTKQISILPLKGKHIRMTEELCREQAKNCKSRLEFKTKYNSAWKYALKNNIMDELFGRLKSDIMKEFDQDFLNHCIEIAKEMKNVSQFRKEHQFECRYLQKYDENTFQSIFPPKEIIEVTLENCYKYGRTCKNRTEFHDKYRNLYDYSIQMKIIDTLFK